MVIAVSSFILFIAPVIVWFLDDGIGFIPLSMVAGVFVAWFLLRRAVRLRWRTAPDDALDERQIGIRNRTYAVGLSGHRKRFWIDCHSPALLVDCGGKGGSAGGDFQSHLAPSQCARMVCFRAYNVDADPSLLRLDFADERSNYEQGNPST